MSHEYYDEHASTFIAGTLDVDMQGLYAKFEGLLGKGDTILDLGCGSGRDLLHFRRQGYRVLGVDLSDSMVRHARDYSGCEVYQASFTDFRLPEKVDGVWACASLLHLEPSEWEHARKRIEQCLKPSGVLYASFKHGSGSSTRGQRTFWNHTPASMSEIFPSPWCSLSIWTTQDARRGREDEMWTNGLLRYGAASH